MFTNPGVKTESRTINRLDIRWSQASCIEKAAVAPEKDGLGHEVGRVGRLVK